MIIAYTSDIHIDTSKENFMTLKRMRQKLKQKEPDIFIIAGDIGAYLTSVQDALSVFRDLDIKKIFIPGNHDIWKEDGHNSYEKYFFLLPDIARENNFIPLWIKPIVINGIGFCGSMGWYDYSLRNPKMRFSMKDYARKEYNGSVWMDKNNALFVDKEKRMRDTEITELLYRRFVKDCESIYHKSRIIIAVLHHVPFKEMIHTKNKPDWDYFSAFMGSTKFGEYLLKKKKGKLVISGHQHVKKKVEIKRFLGRGSIISIASPFGYFFASKYPVEKWYSEMLSFISL
jgi:putative phosphoesterase